MKPTITINEYPIGWEWLDRVPLEDFNWLIEIFAILTDNTDTYNFVGYTDSETLPGHQKICSVDKIPLANFLNEDQGYQTGISMYGHYIACKCLDISSEEEYMNQFTDIRILTCKVYKEPNYILSMSNEEILEFISGLDYMGNIPTVPDLEKPIEIQVSTTRQIPLEQNKEVQTKIKEIIYNNLYDTLIDELKGTISRFQAQYNIQEINPYLQDILQNPEDLVSLSQHHKR